MNTTDTKASRISDAQHINDSIFWSTYAKSLKAVGMSAMLLGLSDIWLVVNRSFIHWPGSAQLVMIATFVLLFYCFRMIFEGKRTTANIIMWGGVAYTSIAALFRTLSWPGGMILEMYGAPNLITILAAIVFLIQLPQEQKWSRGILGAWSICIPLASCVLWYIIMYYQNYIENTGDFEPAIPYAYNCVDYVRHRIMKARVMTLGNGITLFVLSLPLYIIARKHSK